MIFHCVYIYYLFIHLLMNMQLFSIDYLLCTELECTQENRYLSEIVIPILSIVHPEVGLLDHAVVLFLMSWAISILFSILAAPFYIPISSIEVLFFLWVFKRFHCLKFIYFCFFRATPVAYGGSQASHLIRAAAAGLHQSHSNDKYKPHLRYIPQLTAMPDT